MKRWVSWQQRWRACVKSLHGVITRRAVASALHRWRVEATASSDRCRRQAVVGRLLGRALLRKCMLALAKNALSATRIRRLLEYFRKRSLRHALDTWRRWSPQENQERPVSPPPNERKKITNRRHQPGKPRKVHCRCVYAVCRGQRCTCAPRSHLLRRVEELHKLVAQGLGEREGGYRLLSHVVQGTAGGRRGDRYAVERDPCIGLASSRSGCNESRDSPRVCVRPGRRRSTAVEGRTKDGCANADKGSRERRLLAATRSTIRAGAATTALGVPNCSYPGVAGPEPEGFHAASLEGQADLRDTIDVLGASRQRYTPLEQYTLCRHRRRVHVQSNTAVGARYTKRRAPLNSATTERMCRCVVSMSLLALPCRVDKHSPYAQYSNIYVLVARIEDVVSSHSCVGHTCARNYAGLTENATRRLVLVEPGPQHRDKT